MSITGTTKDDPGCISLGTGCYFFIHTKHNWYEASQKCRDMGARLVAIDTELENNVLVDYIENHFPSKLVHLKF